MAEVRTVTKILAALAFLALAACDPTITNTSSEPEVDITKPVTVALLVPLGTGDAQNEAIAQSLVNAARMAEQDLSGVEIDLKVYATGGKTAAAAEAAKKAIGEGAQIIIGPLFGTSASGVAPIAAASGVKVLSFSNNSEIAGDNVYLLGLTFENTADKLIGYAASRGLSNVGVIQEQGLAGDQARRAIEAAAAKNNAQVVGTVSYPASIAGIANASSSMASTLKGAGANAVMLTSGQGYAYVVENMRGLGLKDGVQYLSLPRWDAVSGSATQPGLQGTWFAAPSPGLTAQFDSRYQSNFGKPAHPLASLAYDGMAVVGALVKEAAAEGADDPFSDARLTQASGFAGINGAIRFLPNGLNERALAIFQIADGEMTVIAPASGGFTSGGS